MYNNILKTTAEEIISNITDNEEWFGPNGKCWCKILQKYISPIKDKCKVCKFCSECETLFAYDKKKLDYVHKDFDQKTFGV